LGELVKSGRRTKRRDKTQPQHFRRAASLREGEEKKRVRGGEKKSEGKNCPAEKRTAHFCRCQRSATYRLKNRGERKGTRATSGVEVLGAKKRSWKRGNERERPRNRVSDLLEKTTRCSGPKKNEH